MDIRNLDNELKNVQEEAAERADLEIRIRDCQSSDDLSYWEIEFLDDLLEWVTLGKQYSVRYILSESQQTKLAEIESKVYG